MRAPTTCSDRPGPRLLVSALLSLLLVLPLACGGSSATSGHPKDPGDSSIELTTVGEAEDAFERAERQLQQELIAHGGAQPQPAPVPSAYAPQPLPPPAPSPGYAPGREHDDQAFAAAQSRCTRACRALASMTRSANRLCALDGEDTHRCRNVRERVDAARRLVTAMCPDCR